MSLQKNRLRSAKNVIFSLLCILVDGPMGGFEPPKPPLRTPLIWTHAALFHDDIFKLWRI